MAGDDAGKARMSLSGNTPGPDVLLGLWASWMDQLSTSAQASAGKDRSWWEVRAAIPASGSFSGVGTEFHESLSKNPILHSIDQVWNANPLREVVPVDWAEITRALRIVWLRSLGRPRAAQAVVDFNQDMWRSALQVWQAATGVGGDGGAYREAAGDGFDLRAVLDEVADEVYADGVLTDEDGARLVAEALWPAVAEAL